MIAKPLVDILSRSKIITFIHFALYNIDVMHFMKISRCPASRKASQDTSSPNTKALLGLL